MRGRKPLPSNVVRLRGNPGKRRLNDAEPRPAARVPPCPACLGHEARKEWQRLARELGALGLLTAIVGFGETRIHAETATFEVRASEITAPHPGDQLTIGGETFVVQGEPERRDPDRLVWTLDVRPA